MRAFGEAVEREKPQSLQNDIYAQLPMMPCTATDVHNYYFGLRKGIRATYSNNTTPLSWMPCNSSGVNMSFVFPRSHDDAQNRTQPLVLARGSILNASPHSLLYSPELQSIPGCN
jgi:hypothetical protein